MEARACPACSSPSARRVGEANGVTLVRCCRCRTLFSAGLPAALDEATDYADYYDESNLRIPDFVERRLVQVADEFGVYRRRNRWLDVGCGAGGLMRAAASLGWSVAGTEVAPAAAEAVRAQGFDVHLGEAAATALEDGSFDVVSLVEVVEHVDDPGALVRESARLLRPGGVMYVTTPHGRGLSARLLRERWSAVAPPEHLQLFSTRGLRALLARSGLSVREVRTHALNPSELLGALPGRPDCSPGERVQSGYALNESLSSSRAGNAIKATANATLDLLRLGDTIKIKAERGA